jgi:hypothetical protein
LGKNESRPSKKYNGGNKESFLKYQKRSAKLVGSSKKKVLEFIFFPNQTVETKEIP